MGLTPNLRSGAALLSLVAAGAALAQTATPPDAGRLLEETRPQRPPLPAQQAPRRLLETPTRPPVQMAEGVTVTPSGFRVTGATSFPADELAELLKPWVGRTLDLAGLNEAAGVITRRYQSAGHFLTYAYLPAQRVADGVIEVAVLEGKVDSVQIVNAQDARLRDEVVQAHVGDLVDKQPLLQADVERRLLLLNDIPGVVARGAFAPGASQGAAEMVVSVAEDEPLAVQVTADNYGSRSSGEYRAGVGLQFKDVFGWGDDTTARFLVSNRGALVSGSLGTMVPLGGSGFKFGASASLLRYALGGTFKSLGAEGSAQAYAVRARYPLLRSTGANIALEASLEQKRLHDAVQFIADSNRKRSTIGNGSLVFDWTDAWGGRSGGTLSLDAGELSILDEAARDRDTWERRPPNDPVAPNEIIGPGLQTDGGFKKAGLTLARQQALAGPVSAYVRFTAQFARRNLDSSEKFALGGPTAVRAYAPGEATVDDARLYSAELRYLQDYVGGSLQWSLFFDRALGRYNLNPMPGGADTNHVRLYGGGLGVLWSAGELGIGASLAWRAGSRPPTADGGDSNPRLYLQLIYAP
jgi:hemolysin activation/secretion protein